jgi:hypothetical protein
MGIAMASLNFSLSSDEARTLAHLIQLEFQELYLKWGANQPPRSGVHASSLLVSESEWCVRKHVLSEMYPDLIQPEELRYWDWKRMAVFLDGWQRHIKWQMLFSRFFNVVYWNNLPELDLTHYDDVRNVHYSPDAIVEYAGEKFIVEIKGLDTRKYQEMTSDLDTACKVSDVVAKAKIQCNLYCHLLEIKRGIILVEDKNNQDFTTWVVEHESLMSRSHTDRAYAVKGHVTLARSGKPLPPRVCASPDDSRAKKCPLKNVCFRDLEVK